MKYLVRLMRTPQGGGTYQHASFIQPRSGLQGKSKTFDSAEEFERIRAIIFPSEPETRDVIDILGYVQWDDKELTDEQAFSLGWDVEIAEND
jgi:hypothetical protein